MNWPIPASSRAVPPLPARGTTGDAGWSDLATGLRETLSPDARVAEQERLAPKTTMRVGGPARVFVEPANETDLRTTLVAARAAGLPVLMLGRGSNLLVPDEGVEAVVVALTHAGWQTFAPQADGRVWAGAGLRLKNLCGLAAKAGLSGFEFLEGIPATLGGALRMNAGAMGGWIFDVVDEVHFFTLDGGKHVRRKSEMRIDYRYCGELQAAVAVGAFLRPKAQGTSEDVKRQLDIYQKKRVESQPREPSAGCIFKNPPGNSAGKLIDDCGLKGARVGGAEVSAVHGNFIVNRGEATSADVIALVRQVRAQVKQLRGIDLEPEVLLFGQDWKDLL